ncbi:hypothetical protein G7009_09780 [Pseudomonas capeferrum]|uniref:hypothetical protein n=1 Tax=Pseudomonas capeferrum TaxID=1495066 RepID=UPI0015E30CEC|nr:hypothetical protein [Pseudomonas capeferrum]MBA1202043.1 hypothetical protein [Pseudomonas capeferrum]
MAQLLEPECRPSVAALAGVDHILAALDRIAQGSVDDVHHQRYPCRRKPFHSPQ